GIILASIIFFVTMLASLTAIVASGSKPVSLKEPSVLVLKTGVPIPDRTSQNPFAGFDVVNMTLTLAHGLNDILRNIEKAAADSKIKGILIENGLLSSGWATTGEIRDALSRFRESGKFVIAWSDYLMPQQGYYLSTAADRIYIAPSSTLEFKGLSGEVMFYKKALEKIGVDVQVTRHGSFKGAVEPYILDEMSNENEMQIREYVGSIWSHVTAEISQSRGIPQEKLNLIADRLTSNTAEGAYENNLVDGLLYRDQLIDTLKVLSGLKTTDRIALVPMVKYTRVPDPVKKTASKNRISVIYASGSIVMGKGTENNIGGNNYSDVIRKERLDSSVKAIVLRVNSPGGNAIASDLIWREMALAAEKKPVVISMGNYAASGGYYIAAPGTKIMANPATITGSIGVFALLPDASKLLEQKLGISTETVRTNSYSDFPSLFRPMDSYEKQVMQESIELFYTEFISKVAEGRKMTVEAVDNIGEGRVYSGSHAEKIGLVDDFGGLQDAIREAAQSAGIDTYSVRELPLLEDPYMRLLSQLGGDIKMKILNRELGVLAKPLEELRDIQNISGIQARLPYFIEIR
ncbi:MAG TPA: signal peptide peptidase SppA, partial [Bacteroidales bacterium]|nr:signal peptide peptidase SppA [Bacteroidales bacterium]